MYRADIDGLRAVAILPVVLFHVGFPGFYGGFVGVDVFFVISGYLITGIIVDELRRGRFSILEFYRRRVLRIFPALFAMLAATAVLAYFTMLPSELVNFGESLVATTAFVSNGFFYSEIRYFGPDAHSSPLLHTWSLAVEEQFYLFWPLMLIGLHGATPNKVRKISLTITAASLVLSVFLLERNPSAAFYLIPARAWELMVGVLLAVLGPLALRQGIREALGAAGLVAILIAVKFYNDQMPFPGIAALLPCLGAAAIIAAGGGGATVTGKVLSWRPLVWIGKVSFSLYLWHWPVIVFAQIGFYIEPTLPARAAELLISLSLAALSWRFIEQPFRTSRVRIGSSARKVLAASGLAMAGGFAIGGVHIAQGGWPDRFSPDELNIAKFQSYDGNKLYRSGSCFIVDNDQQFASQECLARRPGVPSVLVVGDSHAAHLWPGLSTIAIGADVLQATRTGCRPTLHVPKSGETTCSVFFRSILHEWLPNNPVDVLILAGRWTRADMASLPATLEAVKHSAKQVILVGPIPQYVSSLPRLLVRESQTNDTAILERGLVQAIFDLDIQMRRIASEGRVSYFSVIDAICHGRSCQSMAAERIPMQFDYGHFTLEGSRIVVEHMANILNETAKEGRSGS